ncbi:hypothetical protein ACA910_020763 [Epithemia clementina (nom. ined.)]
MAPVDTNNGKVRTLQEAIAAPRKHRDMTLALEPMDNFTATPGTPFGLPLAFRAAWELPSRPRRIALLMDDCQEEYREYAENANILNNLVRLVNTFRAKKAEIGEGICIVWSVWSRTFDDGISNSMDRWFGPRGLRPGEPENALYIFTGNAGMVPFKEIAPTEEEYAGGWFYQGRHLDMFWNFDENGKSYLDEKLKAEGIDTVVISGLWTDECILATAFGAFSRGYDVVVVSDATATATACHKMALDVINGDCSKVLTTEDVVSYMNESFKLGDIGQVKGIKHFDGRKDD